MSSDPAAPSIGADTIAAAGNPRPSRRLLGILGLVLAAAVYVAGSPGLDSPWIQGDEFVFIVTNPDVNPAADPEHEPAPLGSRLAAIVTKVHDDLYQPIPILSYAVEWDLTGGEPLSFRRTDLLLHVLNVLLLWWVLATLLAPDGRAGSAPTSVVAWALALLWALHPMLVTTYAADMGRTHLLSATFSLLALRLYVYTLTPGKSACFIGVVAALLAAMLCKPVIGWVLLAFVLEAAHRATVRTPLPRRERVGRGFCGCENLVSHV